MVAIAGQASLLGQQLGNYAVRALLGRGATGTVYLAKDLALGRPVALKVLLGSLARNPDQVERFLQEARAAAPLHHQNIVGVYEAGVRDGVPFIAMEYVEGETLERFLRRNGSIPWEHAVHIAAQVADALHCAHEAGLVHRDVKPANILLDRQGRVRLTDFGIAGVQEEQALQRPGHRFFGTPAYMSPEQCGMNGPIGPQSDLFSLGVILYQMLSGAMPFMGHSTPALIKAIANETPLRLNYLKPGIPDDVARLAAYLLAKRPAERPPSAADVRRIVDRLREEDGGASVVSEALQAYILEQAEPLHVRADTPLPGDRTPAERSRLRIRPPEKHFEPISWMAKAAMGLLLLVSLSGAGYWRYVQYPALPEAAPVLLEHAATRGVNGEIWIDLPGEDWLVESVHWVGAETGVLVAVAGRPGTPVHGSRGVLAVEPGAGRVYSIASPAGSMQDPEFGNGAVDRYRIGPMPAVISQQRLAGMFLLPAAAGGSTPRPGALFAHHWLEGAPRPGPLLRFSGDGPSTGPGEPAGTLALHPDGRTFAMFQREAGVGTFAIVEFEAGGTSEGRLVAAGVREPDIHSLQYSPEGQYLGYVLTPSSGRQELWAAQAGEAPYPVAAGHILDAAFRPGEGQVAVSTLRDGRPEVVLTDLETGRILGMAGPGRVGKESWDPSGTRLLVQAFDPETGELQLWGVAPEAPFARTRLTGLESGAEQVAAVSRDGRWCATASVGREGPAAVFVPLPPGAVS